MQNIKKTLEMTGLLFGMAVLFSFIAWFLGYDGFIIVGNIDIPLWLIYIINPALLCISLSLLVGFVLNIYSWKVLKFSLPLSIISGIFGPFFMPELFTGPVPTIVLIIAIFVRKSGVKALNRLILITTTTILYQFIISKITNIALSSIISLYDTFRLSLSNIILMIYFYSIGGVKYVSQNDDNDISNRKYFSKRLELLVFPGRIRDEKSWNESSSISSQNTENIPVSNFEVWVMRSVIAVVQILQWIIILWVCNLDNYFIDGLVITTSFICHGMIINKRQHIKPIVICTLATTMMFYFCARFTISFQYSHFFPIVIGLFLVYTMYRISYQFEKSAKELSKKDIERIKRLEDQMESAWDKLDKLQ